MPDADLERLIQLVNDALELADCLGQFQVGIILDQARVELGGEGGTVLKDGAGRLWPDVDMPDTEH